MYFEEEERNVLVKKKKKKTKKKKKNARTCGPRIVLTHSYKLSPFGPALQFVGGSNRRQFLWMRFAAEPISPCHSFLSKLIKSLRLFLTGRVRLFYPTLDVLSFVVVVEFYSPPFQRQSFFCACVCACACARRGRKCVVFFLKT